MENKIAIKNNSIKRNTIIGLIASITLIMALVFSWLVPEEDYLPLAKELITEVQSFEKVSSSPLTFAGIAQTSEGQQTTLGYVVIEEADAYGGPIKIATSIDDQGKIMGTFLVDHKDTPSFINKITNQKFFEQFTGKQVTDPLKLNQDIDVISGATYSSNGVAKAVSKGSHAVARAQFGQNIVEDTIPFIFGKKEIIILLLVVLAVIGIIFKVKKLRWVTLIGGLIFIGFYFNTPVSLANIATLLMGNFPSLRENLVWYILLIGIPVISFILGRNVYCFWLCPFGALQELLAKVSGTSFKCKNKAVEVKAMKIKYWLAYAVLLAAFLLRAPGLAGYEPFATIFGLQGIGVQWFILPVVLFTALFIYRFWCRFFCPVMVVNELILKFKRFTKKFHGKFQNNSSAEVISLTKDISSEN